MSKLLAQSGKIGNVELKNRMVMTAMGDLLANSDCTVSDRTIEYYGLRAKGGIGLIFTGIVRVNDTDGASGLNQISLADDKYIPGFKKLADEVHKYGAKIFPQLQHSGRQGVAAYTGEGYVLAPSAIPSAVTQQPTQAMTVQQIKTLVAQFGDAARRAMEAGCDGVELHAAHGYLINQFLSPFSNRREDEYGGSLENRMRFLMEIYEDVREKTDSKIPVTVRLTVDEFLDTVGITEPYLKLEESIEIVKILEKAGIDAINVSCGTYETLNTAIEPVSFAEGWRKDFIKAIKDSVSIPVIAVSKFRNPEIAEQFMEEGIIDYAGFARPLLADPYYPNKVVENKEEQIRHCISCLFCFDELLGSPDSNVSCAVNPRTGFESQFPEKPVTDDPKTVVIVGAGPAGLKAAHTLKEYGHNPILLEKGTQVGGQVVIGKNPPKKGDLNYLIDYYEKEIDRLGIDLRLNTKATPESVKALNPDIVLLAVGTKPIVPKIAGVEQDNVYNIEEILKGDVKLKDKNIAIIGSGLTGLEVAEFLQQYGNKITVVEMQETLAPGAYVQNLLDVQSRLAKDTEYLLSHKLVEIKPDEIVMEKVDGGEKVSKKVDAVVLSVGYKPDSQLISGFDGVADKVIAIGDADTPKNIGTAIRSAYRTVYDLI